MSNPKNQSNPASGHWSPYFVSSDTRETKDLVGQNIATHTLEHKSSQKRPVTVRYRTASLNKLTFHDMAYSMFGDGEAHIYAPEMSHIYLCEINLGGAMEVGERKTDRSFGPGQIYMVNANRPHSKRWASDGRQMMIRIHQRDMEAAVERMSGTPINEPLLFDRVPVLATGRAATLASMIDALCADLELDTPFFVGRPGESAEQLIIELMLQALPNNYSHLLTNPEPNLQPRHVRHAAQYIHAHASEVIHLDDLVTASGVSPRSLHSGFKKYYGVSPMTYLRNVRLDLARLRFKAEGVAETSVTDVALSCGFTHLSKFAQAYKERFGELPSESLRNV